MFTNRMKWWLPSLLGLHALLILGCDHKIRPEPSSFQYRLLIGTTSLPAYDSVRVGEVFGSEKTLMVLAPDVYGTIRLIKNGVPGAMFHHGGIVCGENEGRFAIEGENTREILIYVLERKSDEEHILRHKFKIPEGEIDRWTITLPLQDP